MCTNEIFTPNTVNRHILGRLKSISIFGVDTDVETKVESIFGTYGAQLYVKKCSVTYDILGVATLSCLTCIPLYTNQCWRPSWILGRNVNISRGFPFWNYLVSCLVRTGMCVWTVVWIHDHTCVYVCLRGCVCDSVYVRMCACARVRVPGVCVVGDGVGCVS
jgi:hypothetical protein